MVWFDAQPKFWESFGLSFGKDIWNAKIIDCFDELYDNYFGCKINWDEPSFFEIIDELIDYPVKKIILYRENIWEKVISEELAIQTNHWIAPIGRHRVYKEGYEFDEIDVDVVKNKIKDIENKVQYIPNKKQASITEKECVVPLKDFTKILVQTTSRAKPAIPVKKVEYNIYFKLNLPSNEKSSEKLFFLIINSSFLE